MRLPGITAEYHPALRRWGVAAFLAMATLALFAAIPAGIFPAFSDKLPFSGLGVIGAIFANSTGAGGGVVFIPAFASMGLTETQAVATSFGIQCFGMTAGALSWTFFYRRHQSASPQWSGFFPAIAVCAALSICGLWTVYALGLSPPAGVTPTFAAFSLFLGASILLVTRLAPQTTSRSQLDGADILALAIIAYLGGGVTAWLSVGVGEFVAFYLILRRYDVTFAVAVAVVISAITVWSAAPQQLLIGESANWHIIAFAGPGAIVGGLLARRLVLILGANRLKLFFGSWLLLIGLVEFIPVV